MESGGPSDYDAGKKIKGRKRQFVTDTNGFLVGLVVHEANIQDRDGAVRVLCNPSAGFIRFYAMYLLMAVTKAQSSEQQ